MDDSWDEEYRGQSWELGDDHNCENCGWTWNEAQFDPDFHGENAWEFNYRVGCYGGDSLSYFSEDREEKLKEMFEHLRVYPGWPRRQEAIIRDMIEDCDRLREQK